LANIATIFVRLTPGGRIHETGGRWPGISEAEILAILLASYHGSSYCVPLWLWSHDGKGLEIQYGAKWGPNAGPVDLWERREEADIGSIWVRWFDSGGEFDLIYAAPELPPGRSPCRYAFDEIEVRIGDAIERRPLAGTYLCGNDRGLPKFDHPLPPSPTTPPGSSTSLPGDIQPAESAAIIRDLRERATSVSFFFRKRLVHLAEQRWGRWADYALDDWDNCADPEFVRASGR
jgi:hypothetical protein